MSDAGGAAADSAANSVRHCVNTSVFSSYRIIVSGDRRFASPADPLMYCSGNFLGGAFQISTLIPSRCITKNEAKKSMMLVDQMELVLCFILLYAIR